MFELIKNTTVNAVKSVAKVLGTKGGKIGLGVGTAVLVGLGTAKVLSKNDEPADQPQEEGPVTEETVEQPAEEANEVQEEKTEE